MSLILASRLCESLGITTVTVTPDGDPRFATVTADRDLTPGMAAKLRNRIVLAAHSHRRSMGESVGVMDEAWVLYSTDRGAWLLSHGSCRLNQLTQRGETVA